MSDSLKVLKERIYNDDKVELLLEELGCDAVTRKASRKGDDDLVTARIPDSANPRSVQIYLNPFLNSSIVNRGITGDIYAIVGYLLYDCETFDDVKSHLYQIKTYICNTLNYDDLNHYVKPLPKVDWNSWLRPIQKQREREIEIVENVPIDDKLLNQFVQYPWGDWFFNEEISLETQRTFGICYDIRDERVCIPVHNKLGQFIGVKGRYVGSDKATLDEKKYRYVIPCSKSIELFNLHRALPYIQKEKKVIAVEGAKTVMKLWGWDIRNAVSFEGDKLSPVQVKLLKELGIDIEFVFAWDKGKDEDYVLNQLKQVKNRKVSYLYDTDNHFIDKDSPTDKGFDAFMNLYNNFKIPVNKE